MYFRLCVREVNEHCLEISEGLAVMFDLWRLVRHACAPGHDGAFPISGDPQMVECRGLAGLCVELVQVKFSTDSLIGFAGAVVLGRGSSGLAAVIKPGLRPFGDLLLIFSPRRRCPREAR